MLLKITSGAPGKCLQINFFQHETLKEANKTHTVTGFSILKKWPLSFLEYTSLFMKMVYLLQIRCGMNSKQRFSYASKLI